MADEISLAPDLKQSLERTKWKECGVRGFLIGRQRRGHVYVLNVWVCQSSPANASNDLWSELLACQNHLCAGTEIVGVIVVVKSSKQSDVEKYLESLPLEVQTVQSAPQGVVCSIQTGVPQPVVAFHRRLAEDKRSLKRLSHRPLAQDFDEGLVIFRIRAKLPIKLQLDNSQPTDIEVWGEKMSKAFANIEAAITSGGYTYGFRDTHMFLSEGSVIGTQEKITTVQRLYSEVMSNSASPARKKDRYSKQLPVVVDMYQQVSGESEHFAQPACAPAIHQRTGSYRFLKLTLPMDVVVEVDGEDSVKGMPEVFNRAIMTQIQAMQQCLQQHQSRENEFYTPESFHFSIPQRHCCVTVVYPRTVSEDSLAKRRQYLHEQMCLSLDMPVFRRANARVFPGQQAEGGYIINPHLDLPPSKVSEGTPHVVRGNYSYHHYMQDRFDDDKWGCAYRSLQTIVSWFRFQGYTDKPTPSHREIQQALVAVGDKEASFVGSKKWIGSFEVSYCLDHLLGVTSKFLNVSAGAELASKGRELAQHFDTEGTPIMIGGGVLAHTILGVDYSEKSGEIKFLILDPHYTGGEDLPTIQREGWCGWKGADFWNPTAHYNLCMPQRPICF